MLKWNRKALDFSLKRLLWIIIERAVGTYSYEEPPSI
jgi:hypothetical protein